MYRVSFKALSNSLKVGIVTPLDPKRLDQDPVLHPINRNLKSSTEFSEPFMRPQQSMAATEVKGRERMEPRELDECVQIHRSSPEGARQLTDDELVMLVQKKVQSLLNTNITHLYFFDITSTGDPRALAGGGPGGRLSRGGGAQEVHRATEQEVPKMS